MDEAIGSLNFQRSIEESKNLQLVSLSFFAYFFLSLSLFLLLRFPPSRREDRALPFKRVIRVTRFWHASKPALN